MQRAAIAPAGPMSPAMNMALAFPVTLALAVASWYLMEKPPLARHALANALGRFRRVRGSPASGAA